MHKLTKITPLTRKIIYEEFTNWEIKIKDWDRWKFKIIKKVGIQDLALKYNVHRNTVSKIISRWKIWDFTIHKSTTFKNRTIEFWLKRLSRIEKKLEKIILRREIEKTRYEKDLAWEMLHIDVFKLKNIKWENSKDKKYLAWIIDDSTRICYVEIISNKKASTLAQVLKRAKNNLVKDFWFDKIRSMLSDNWLEFTTYHKKSRFKHKFEIELNKLWIKHKYTRVRRPQTNWKIERFWRIFNEEFFYKNNFISWNDFEIRFKEYMSYYNKERKHWWIQKQTPLEKLNKLKSEWKIYWVYEKKLEVKKDEEIIEKCV